MAINLENTISIDLGRVVANSLTAVSIVRQSEQARKESEFQKAVAAGMSYKDQIKFREQQLEEIRSSGFIDPEYIADLEVSVAETKKLARFEAIRIKYKESLDDYVNGKSSISQYIGVLNEILDGEQDPEKQQEISDLLSSARKEQTDIEINAIKNRSLLAQKDTSVSLINKSISEVKSKRTLASINKNDDEVAMWDDTLLSLQGAKSKLLIENGLNEITFQSNRQNLKSNDKLGLLNGFISDADASSPVTYDGITYPSLKAYWENKRGEYFQGAYFDDIKKELDTQTATIAATSSYGQVPVARIQAVNDFYNTLKNKPEFAPYLEKIEQQRVESITGMSNELYTSLVDEANATGNFGKAETAITGVENRFGIKIARPAFDSEAARNQTIADTTITDITKPTVTPVTSQASQTNSDSTQVASLTEQLQQAQAALDAKRATPPVTPPIKTTPPPPVAPNPTVSSTTPQGYTGDSLVDYLKSIGQDSSFAARAKLAAEKGIVGYARTAEQNTQLLKLLRG